MQPEQGRIIDVVHVDDSYLVVNKPAGLLCVPGKGPDKQDCLSQRVIGQFADALVVHRLDMATSGLVVFARGPTSQRTLNQAFAQRQVHKRYVAIVTGNIPAVGEWHIIDLPIMVDWPNRPLRKIDAAGQQSVTRFRVLAGDTQQNATRVELEPITGRTHQLRVHLRAIGHPIVGDALYNPLTSTDGSQRLLLHAEELSFLHPFQGTRKNFARPAPF